MTFFMFIVFRTVIESKLLSASILSNTSERSFWRYFLLKNSITSWSMGCCRLVTLGGRKSSLIPLAPSHSRSDGWVGTLSSKRRALEGSSTLWTNIRPSKLTVGIYKKLGRTIHVSWYLVCSLHVRAKRHCYSFFTDIKPCCWLSIWWNKRFSRQQFKVQSCLINIVGLLSTQLVINNNLSTFFCKITRRSWICIKLLRERVH